MAINGVLKDKSGNLLYPRTHIDNIKNSPEDADSPTVSEIINSITSGSDKESITISTTTTDVGDVVQDTSKTDVWSIAALDITLPSSMDKDVWYDIYDTASLDIHILVSVYGMLHTTNGMQIPVNVDGNVRFKYNFETKQLSVMVIDNGVYTKGDLVLLYLRDNAIIKPNKPVKINKPFIISPEADSTIEMSNSTFEVIASEFSTSNGTDIFIGSEWKLTKDLEGADIIKSDADEDVTSHIFSTESIDSEYMYISVRYKGQNCGYSEWSDPVKVALVYSKVLTPSIIPPTDNTIFINNNHSFEVESTKFAVNFGEDAHVSSDWKITFDIEGENIYKEVTSSTDLTNYTFTDVDLPTDTVVYLWVRHCGINLGLSEWSLPAQCIITNVSTLAPVIIIPKDGDTVFFDAMGVSDFMTVMSSDLATSPATVQDEHLSSDWKITSDANGDNVVIKEYGSTISLTSWEFVTQALPIDQPVYLWVRHNARIGGLSDWSAPVSITCVMPKVNTPYITSPLEDSIALIIGGTLDAESSAFSVNAGIKDTHVKSDWKVTSDIEGNTILSQAFDSTDLTSHTFTDISSVSNGEYIYIWVKHYGDNYGASDWSVPTRVKVNVGKVNQPSITAPTDNSNAVANGGTLIIISSAFSTNISLIGTTEKHVKTDWKITSDADGATVVVENLGSTTNLTSWSTTLNLSSATTLYLWVRYYGATYGVSEWSNPVRVNASLAYIQTPSITSPVSDGASIMINKTIAASSNAFGVVSPVGASINDTHASSDWKLTTDAAGNNILQSVTASTSDKTSHTFTAITSTYANLYIFVRYKGTKLGYSSWSLARRITITDTMTAYGRTFQRHSSNAGTVMTVNDFGTTRRILVLDASYRTTRICVNLSTGTSTCTATPISYSGSLSKVTAGMTDATINSSFAAIKDSTTSTANTTAMVNSGANSIGAANWCRQKSVSGVGYASLPNINILLRIFAAKATLDSLDPTTSTTYKLSSWSFSSKNYAWSSTEQSGVANQAWSVASTGMPQAYSDKRTTLLGVIPIIEL